MSLTYEDLEPLLSYFQLHDNRPWMIGFSGGKDSTLLVTLCMEMLKTLHKSEINKKVYIVSSDTGVENPIVRDYMHKMSALIGEKGENLGIISSVKPGRVYDIVIKWSHHCHIIF